MNFLKKLFSARPPAQRAEYLFKVKCNRCGEIVVGRIDLANDLSADYEDAAETYYVRKVLIGEKRCFQRIEASFKFSADKKIVERNISGGELVS